MAENFSEMQAWGESLLKGNRVFLRAVEPDDVLLLAQWWNQPGEAVFQQDRIALKPISPIERQFEEWSSNDSPSGCGYSVVTEGNVLVGHVTLWGLSLPTRIATCAIIIGPDYQNNGYGTEALRLALRIAFEEMNANKVEIQAWDYNERALHVYRELGFVEEGRRRAATFHKGVFHDHVQMGMLASEYYPLHSNA